ncbi:tyrosine-protein kinase Srms [Ascaphus truei]|uniref:tyrosine-protein kinase Srms n=1 Tax=Ascaphus truei TaxID=8439 RepID=UPI003F5AB9D1
MEPFLRKYLSYLGCLWDKIWPQMEERWEPMVVAGSSAPHNLYQSIVVLYDFNARSADELSVKQGEELFKISDEGDYMMARKVTGSMELGLVPANYVTQQSVTSIHEPWYAEVKNRAEAEALLMSPPNAHGSYLIRPSESDIGQYSLSVRKHNKVTHFRIQKDAKGEYYIEKGRCFPGLPELVVFHRTNWRLIKCPLLQPCEQQVVNPGDSWERPRSEFTQIKKLGEGNFGEVWEGIWRSQEKVAIKTFKQEDMNQSDFKKEIDALKSLYHRNLIQLLAVCSIGEPVYIVTELMTKGNLQTYLNGKEGHVLSTTQLLHVIAQVADGMAYLEVQHVVHRDLAARNVLVGDNLICKIADFGLARLLKDDIYSPEKNVNIPVKWTAPEALKYNRYSTKSDVWSFGILLYEVFTLGKQPYQGMNNREVFQKISEGYRLPRPHLCSAAVYNLMEKCWMNEPPQRPSFQELVTKLTFIQRSVR